MRQVEQVVGNCVSTAALVVVYLLHAAVFKDLWSLVEGLLLKGLVE